MSAVPDSNKSRGFFADRVTWSSHCEVWAALGVCVTDVDLATFPLLVCLLFLNHNYHTVLTHGDVLCGKVLVRVKPMLVGYCKLADPSRPKKPSVMAALSTKQSWDGLWSLSSCESICPSISFVIGWCFGLRWAAGMEHSMPWLVLAGLLLWRRLQDTEQKNYRRITWM